MDNYLVSARKYRPSTFRSVIGQKNLTQTLKNAIATGKLAHAYLFCGPRGVGKTTCARIFAKTINCLTPTAEGEACNTCESCVAMNEQRSFNIHELDAASNNSVDDIRELINQVRVPPQVGKYKVYIIDEVHMLSPAAFNAFLKTLEEPPHHAIFILATTEKHKVLPTILSRCQIYDFSRISLPDTVDHLRYVAEEEGITAEEEALTVIAQKADGGMRDALSIFDQVSGFAGGNLTYKAVIDNLNVLDFEYYFRLTETILAHQVAESWLVLNDILLKGFDGQNLLTGLASHFRDLLLCKDERTASMFEVGASIRERYIDLAHRCDTQFLYRAIEQVNDADMKYRLSRNKRLLMDLLLVRLCQDGVPMNENTNNQPITPITPRPTTPAPTSLPNPAPPTRETSVPLAPAPTPRTVAPRVQSATARKPQPTPNLGVSLSALANEASEATKTTILPTQGNEREPFSQDALATQWRNFIGTVSHEEVLLKQMLLQTQPILKENFTIEVTVNHPGQKEQLEQKATDVLNFLRQALRNYSIVMNIRISEAEEKRAIFTTEEKFRYMTEQNNALLKLKETFDLELE